MGRPFDVNNAANIIRTRPGFRANAGLGPRRRRGGAWASRARDGLDRLNRHCETQCSMCEIPISCDVGGYKVTRLGFLIGLKRLRFDYS
eukprot:gene2188-30218_t